MVVVVRLSTAADFFTFSAFAYDDDVAVKRRGRPGLKVSSSTTARSHRPAG